MNLAPAGRPPPGERLLPGERRAGAGDGGGGGGVGMTCRLLGPGGGPYDIEAAKVSSNTQSSIFGMNSPPQRSEKVISSTVRLVIFRADIRWRISDSYLHNKSST